MGTGWEEVALRVFPPMDRVTTEGHNDHRWGNWLLRTISALGPHICTIAH